MPEHTSTQTQQKAARIAGVTYLLIILSSITSMFIGPYRLLVPGDTQATCVNIASHQLFFRAGILYDVLMYAAVVVLAVALYVTLKPVNRYLALTAMLWRVGEAVLGCLGVAASLAAALLLGNGDYLTLIGAPSQQGLVGLILEIKDSFIQVVFVFLSLGTITYCILFYQSRYLPRWISVFGIAAFMIALIGAFSGILFSFKLAMVSGAPAILFEITIGLRLWIKGITVRPRTNL